MGDLADIRSAILSRIETGFTAITAIAWPGIEAATDGVNHALQVDVQFAGREPTGLGASARSRIRGQAELTVLARADATAQPGTDELEGYLDNLAALFPRGLSIAAGANNLRFREPQPGPTLNLEGWVGRQLTCPFWLDN
jgi:hypothetical protein